MFVFLILDCINKIDLPFLNKIWFPDLDWTVKLIPYEFMYLAMGRSVTLEKYFTLDKNYRSVRVVRVNIAVLGRSSSILDPALRALAAPVDQLDTVDSGLTSCESGSRATQRDECCCCRWSPRRLTGGQAERSK